jgi:hypothetical protein
LQQETEAKQAPANKLAAAMNENTKYFVLSVPNMEILRYGQHVGEVPVSRATFAMVGEGAIIFVSVSGSDTIQGAFEVKKKVNVREEWGFLWGGAFSGGLQGEVMSLAEVPQ